MRQSPVFAFILVFAAVSFTSQASAHFKLLQPQSWLNEDDAGGPQKGSPCGPGGTGLLGDDVQPVPTSGALTEVHAGDTVSVQIEETVYHPGHFRIALAQNREDFTIPAVDDPASCAYDLDSVPTGAHDNVLADGLWKQSATSGSNRMLMQDVTIPDQPCEKCTLQVVQVMLNHGLSSCYYYHCADVKILPKATGAAGSASAAGAGGSSGPAAGAGAAGTTMPVAGSAAAGSGGASGTGSGTVGGVTAGTSASAGNSSPAGTSGAGATAGTTAAGSAPPPTAATDSGGCAIALSSGSPAANLTLLTLLAGALLLTGRRRRARSITPVPQT